MNDLEYNPNAQKDLEETMRDKSKHHGHDQQKWKQGKRETINKSDGESALKQIREEMKKA